MNATAILERLEGLGVTVTLDGDEVVARPGNKVPRDLIPAMKACKPQLIDEIKKQDENRFLTTMPFPIGLRGLPEVQVIAAEGWSDAKGFTDPVDRRINLYSWLLMDDSFAGHALCEAVRQEYCRLWHEEYPDGDCGWCDV